MAEIARRTKRYPTDLTDEEWERIKPLLPKAPKRGRKISVDLREMLNAIRYMARSGGGWRMLPTNFGPWQTVYWWFRRFVRRMLFQTIHDVSLMLDRECSGREASPSGGVLDSQTVKAPNAKARGYDANKKIVGRKRHIAVDTDGRPLMVNLTTADISDSAGAQAILDAYASAGLGSSTCSPMVPTTAPSCSTKPLSVTSCWRSCAAATRTQASKCSHGAGWSNAHSAG